MWKTFRRFVSSYSSWTIRNKLLGALVGLVAIALILTNVSWIFSVQSTISESIIRSHEELARSAAVRVDDFINAKVRNLILRSQSASFIRMDIPAAKFDMSLMLREDGDLQEISFLDRSGKEVIKLTPEKVFEAQELTDQRDSDKFKLATFRYGIEYLGPIYFSPTGEPMMTIAVPVVIPEARRNIERITTIEPGLFQRSPGDIFGLISAEVDMSNVLRSVSTISVGESGYIYIVDGSGVLIAHPDQGLVEKRTSLEQVDIIRRHIELDHALRETGQAHQGETVATSRGMSEAQEEVLATHYHMNRTGWGIVVQEPVESVFSPLIRMEQLAFAFLLFGMLATVIAGTRLAKLIARPIGILKRGADIIGEGNLAHRIAISSKDETGDLARSFNTMAEKLSHSIEGITNARLIAESERNKLSLVLSGVTDAVIAVDFKYTIISFNRAAEELTGFKVSDALGQPISRVVRLFEGRHEIPSSDYCASAGLPNAVAPFERHTIRLLSAAGVERTVRIATGSIDGASAIGLGCIMTIHDLSRELIAERAKSRFISIAAHQMRTPLTGIKWALLSLLDGSLGTIKKEQRDVLLKGQAVNENMILLVNDLLDVARIEEGRFGYEFARYDFKVFLERIVELIRLDLEKKRIVFSLVVAGNLPLLLFDIEKLRIAFLNILENAINYTPEGGTIAVRVARHADVVETIVTDTGMGIPPHDMERLFTRFFRGSNAVTVQVVGSGLGLFLARSILLAHGGDVKITSIVGVGTTVTLVLPVNQSKIPHQLLKGNTERNITILGLGDTQLS
ncbi:hypothetical protein A2761_01820 [Candidatus Kaiserbacteria bacterium RIFCSPHIGHO2_01_FULL_51_33]|uniref:histidine kinase n=1 Tax=Candidatus Kaiserbacteria bacterium RIFCSPLOWO2_01_FULL_51_21 TaxID=1798508 RepID=A0A1F6ED56_9BACT|nr:MAG: hypothetical protein A2761_01820 [Candidatus Kaiserbacteria bacterium RIFCSPHIGHO2_01_FULL_51_33]OGG71540.1 MAG: hypothetical protein A3A35_00120 [Candidatus Kaiserbacteria bacterium RIFCSPLOWO2_01_FULL_51_21]